MKHFIFLEAHGPVDALHECLLARFARRTTDGTSTAVNLVQQTGTPTPWHAVLEIWNAGHDVAWAEAQIDRHVARRVAYRVTELIGKDVGPERGWPTPGPKLIVPWIGRADITPAEQRRHWDEHVPLANRIHVGCRRYVRNWIEAPVPGRTAAPPYQGIATQHYLTEQDLRERSFDAPASVQVINDDVAEFIAEHVVLQTVEYFVTR